MNRREPWLLFLGDIVIFTFSLWLSLFIRSGQIPTITVFNDHLIPFGFLFAIWFVLFFIAGLYEKQTTLFKSLLPTRLLNTQILNSLIAVVFFYFIPYFGITPKTILFIYLLISLFLIFTWRFYGSNLIGYRSRELAMIVGRGTDIKLLSQEVNNNSRYGLDFISFIDLDRAGSVDIQKDIIEEISNKEISTVVIDLQNKNLEKNLAHFYNLLFSKVRFIDLRDLYEEVFDRVMIPLLDYSWFLENISLSFNVSYDFFKRIMDIIVATILGIISLIFYPLIFLLIKLDDRGSIFIFQNRVGRNNSLVRIIKFRTMSFNDDEEVDKREGNKITRVGKFLRKSRLDEIPQLWNVLKGDLSLIGPRPELPSLVNIYEKEIPYYNVRHLIKPGLSGWAQLYHDRHPHQGLNTEETMNKLSYDLFYIKNRSPFLDFRIALKTIKIVLSQSGK